MEAQIGACTLELVQDDITLQRTEAIVNAANHRLAGGGGVDGAIHRAGGPQIMAETRQRYPQGCPTGDAVITEAGHLAARYVIHAVGPIWSGGQSREAELLASAYRRSLELASQHGCQSIALPSLSTGAYGYPLPLAARTALHTAITYLETQGMPELLRFVLYDPYTYDIYAVVLGELRPDASM